MAAGTRGTNTFAEALLAMVADFSAMKTLPDVDMEWVINMETEIVKKAREPLDLLQQQGATSIPPDLPMLPTGGMGGGELGGVPGGPPGPGGGVPGPGVLAGAPERGVPNLTQGPPPDELARILGQ